MREKCCFPFVRPIGFDVEEENRFGAAISMHNGSQGWRAV